MGLLTQVGVFQFSKFLSGVKFKDKIDRLLLEGIPTYIHTVSLYSYDEEDHFSTFFDEHYQRHWIGKHPYEGWHAGSMTLQLIEADLYKVDKKQ